MVNLLFSFLAEHSLALRFLKIVSVVLFSAGVFGTCIAKTKREQNFFGLRVFAPGYFGTWLFGFSLMWIQGRSAFIGWLLSVVLLSFVIGTVVIHFAMTEQLMGRWARGMLITLMVACLWLMVVKPGGQ